MIQKQELLQDIDLTITARTVAETFEEVAAVRLMAIRGSVAQTRHFLEEMSTVYRQVRDAHNAYLAKPAKKKSPKADAEFGAKNNKTVRILLSANRGLYGDLPLRIANDFLQAYLEHARTASKDSIDVVVVGVVGQYILDNPPEGGEKVAFKAFHLDDDNPSPQDISAIVQYVAPYEHVIVTYGKYQSLLNLISETEDISGGTAGVKIAEDTQAKLAGKGAMPESEMILFEPSIGSITQFFETEILGALLRQKIYEMQLARFAGRMIAMDNASVSASERLHVLGQQRTKMKRLAAFKKMQQLFAGASLWAE